MADVPATAARVVEAISPPRFFVFFLGSNQKGKIKKTTQTGNEAQRNNNNNKGSDYEISVVSLDTQTQVALVLELHRRLQNDRRDGGEGFACLPGKPPDLI
jgi:ATP-dependent exoDNAse (exonuclease V) alpha subunit